MVKMGLIGYGYWGKNLLRNMMSSQKIEVVGVIDNDPNHRSLAQHTYPGLKTYNSVEELTQAEELEAMVIATPPASHKHVAVECLEKGLHVLVEKPLALSTEECVEILQTAEKVGKNVMVDHTFVYNSPVIHLQEQINKGELGDLLYYDSVRVNLGGFQPQVNVLWDLAPHDLSIVHFWSGGKMPEMVQATGIKHFGSSTENMCYVNMKYNDSFNAHLHLNWAAPFKSRQVIIAGDKKMAVYDDTQPMEKIKIYDKTVQLDQADDTDFRVNYRVGSMFAPAIKNKEALLAMVEEFAASITEKRQPLTDGIAGAQVVQILEALSKSLANDGRPVDIQNRFDTQNWVAKTA
ncbi:MAG: Gfo/Idh/MocA family oxidoreductase [Bdellovibrionales bacterium]|nr:Gfo/Idh/MocA family oxidoreductase [Bdellovibrionales bacterium]